MIETKITWRKLASHNTLSGHPNNYKDQEWFNNNRDKKR